MAYFRKTVLGGFQYPTAISLAGTWQHPSVPAVVYFNDLSNSFENQHKANNKQNITLSFLTYFFVFCVSLGRFFERITGL